jgi:hypothetical protein
MSPSTAGGHDSWKKGKREKGDILLSQLLGSFLDARWMKKHNVPFFSFSIS